MAAPPRPLAGAWDLNASTPDWAWIRPLPGGVPVDVGFAAACDLVQLPPSKSHAQRMLLLAALLPGVHDIHGIDTGLDVQATLRAVRALGAGADEDGDRVRIRGLGAAAGSLRGAIHCGENGTLLRTIGTIVPALGGSVVLDAAPGLRRRPVEPLLTAWQAMGIQHAGDWPLTTRAPGALPLLPQRTDARVTTQVATGLLLAIALRGGGTLVVESPGSRDYLLVTTAVLRAFGFAVDLREAGADLTFAISGSAAVRRALQVPRDPSARAFVAALACMHGHPVPAALADMGACEHPDAGIDADLARLSVPGEVTLAGLAARPDSVPALACAAACRSGTTHLPGLAVLRVKESDRLEQLARGLTACGARCNIVDQGLSIAGPLQPASGPVTVECAPDHRIVMALALMGTVLPEGIRMPHPHCVAKSWPTFWAWLSRVAHVVRWDG